jgi:hypothetical protein
VVGPEHIQLAFKSQQDFIELEDSDDIDQLDEELDDI